ncbi:MAG TPA: hypothetical protein VK858_10235, partial [Longimicrobiales bacterium]|nr:hypothetical protein [Longimicrobiales bacterium]
PPLFSPGTRWTAGPDRAVFVAVTAGYDIDVYEPPTFALARRIHRPVPALEPTEELAVASVGDGMRVMTPAGARTCDPLEVVEQRGMASPVPPITELVVSPAGEIFVERWSLPDEEPAIDVLSSGGDYLGTLPPGFPLPEGFLDEDRFVVTEEDELGLQSVAVYALRR